MVAKRPKTRSKPRKSKTIQIRVTEEQKLILDAAAEKAGLTMSGWVLSVALERARGTEK